MIIIKIDTEDNIYNIDLEYDTDIFLSLKNIDSNTLELIYEWDYENDIIQCYGCLESDCNIKNKHTLPSYGLSNIIDEKSEECNIYGNIYICNKKSNKNFYDSDYGTLYFNINEYNNENMDNTDDNKIEIFKNDMIKNDLFKNKYISNCDTELLDYDNNNYLKI
jgi:hypothetical protein